jgi:hypothetical protein
MMDLQDSFLSILVACLTYKVHRFGALGLLLQRISKRTESNFFEFVALFLSSPCFMANQFFFKVAYSINQLRLRRIGLYCSGLGGHNLVVEFDELGRALSVAAQSGEGLNNVRSCLKRAERSTEFCKALTNAHANRSPKNHSGDMLTRILGSLFCVAAHVFVSGSGARCQAMATKDVPDRGATSQPLLN